MPIFNPNGNQVSEIVLPNGNTASEVVAPDGSVVFGIPDSAIYRYNGSETGVSDGQTVDPWTDLVGSVDLDGIGYPSLNTGSLNGTDAVDTDGTDDAFRYDQNLSTSLTEPATVLWAVRVESLPTDGIVNLWRQELDGETVVNEILIRTDANAYRLNIAGTYNEAGSPSTGDHIFTMAIDDSTAILRDNGTKIGSVDSSADQTVLDAAAQGFYFADGPNDRRYTDALVRETIVHDQRLSGSALTDEEERLEAEAGMNVL